jgi:predicted DNA binding CopG/RHH family protein
MKKKISVNDLTADQFEEIMTKVAKKKNIPLIKSEQINMRIAPDLLFMAKELAKKTGKPVTTFLSDLLKEDIQRLWSVMK